MSTRLQHNMDKKAPTQRLSSLSPVALVVMGLVGAADALASVREALLQSSKASDGTVFPKTTVMDYNAVASLVQALVREGMAPEEAALRVQSALQGPNPLAALSAMVTSVAVTAGAESAQDVVSLSTLVESLSEQVALMAENGQSFDMALLQDVVPSSAGFAQADLAQALETFKALEQGAGASARGGNAEVAQNQIDLLLAQATQTGSAVASDAGAATTATASGAASGAAAVGALSAAQAVALLGLAAVAGGALSSESSSAATTTTTTAEESSSGNVVKGPINAATVFRDLNGNYILDSGEYSATTDASGGYTLRGSGGTIVATGGTDTVTNLSFTGMLAAPSSAKVVTPLTTLLAANPDLSVTELMTSLGLTVNPLSFNPYAAGADATAAAAAEKAAAQVSTVLTNLAVVLKNAGESSLALAVKNVAFQLASKLESQAASSSAPIDLADTAVLGQLGTAVQTAAATRGLSVADDTLASFKSSVATYNQAIKDVVGTNLSNIGNAVKTAQQAAIDLSNNKAPTVSNPIADISVNEDSPLSGSSGSSGNVANTLPAAFEAKNIGLANLRSLFAGDTNAAAPTLKVNLAGYAIQDTGTSSVDITVSLQKPGLGDKSLSIVLNDVLIDAATDGSTNGTTLTLPAQNLSAALKIGNFEVGRVTLSNLDADQLLLVDGNNTIGASPSFVLKLQSLMSKLDNYGGTGILDLATLSAKQSAALVGAFILTNLEDTSTAGVIAKLKSLITLPSTADTVSEMVSVIQRVIDFPAVSSLKVSDIKAQIASSDSINLLNLAATRVGILDTDTLSSALNKLGANSELGGLKLSQVADLLSNGAGIDSGVNLMSLAKDLVLSALNIAPGLTGEDIVTKLSEALVSAYNNDALSLLDSLNLYGVAGTSNADMVKLLSDANANTLHYKDLIALMANSVLGSDATLKVKVDGFSSTLSVTKDAASVSALEVSVPLTANDTYTMAGLGYVFPANTFFDPDTLDKLAYTATLSDGKPLPDWLKFDPLTRSFSGTPDNDSVGSLSVKVTARDPAGNKASDEFTITVNNTNDAPTFKAGASSTLTATEFTLINQNLAELFVDVDKTDTLSFSAVGVNASTGVVSALPTGWSLSTAGVLTGTAPANLQASPTAVDTYTIRVTATDSSSSHATVSKDFTLTVTNDNDAPSKPTVRLESDNGSSSTDGITSNGTVLVSGLEPNATWQYTLNGNASSPTWVSGSGTSFVLSVGEYTSTKLLVRQTDQAGNNSTGTSFTTALDVRTAPVTPTISLDTADSGNIGDGTTNIGLVNVGSLLSGSAKPAGYWQYSTNGGTTWSPNQSLSTSTFTLSEGVYAADKIMVRQSDGEYDSLSAKIASAVTIDTTKPVLTATLDSLNTTTGAYTVKFVSTEALFDFDVSDVTVSSGTKASALTAIGSDGKIVTLGITPAANSASSATAADVTVSVAANAATDSAGNELSAAKSVAVSVLFGSASAQTLNGTANSDIIYGVAGADTVNALAGNDSILGGTGNDVISGGAGADMINLSKGGSDVLKLEAATDSPVSGADTIVGFSSGDKIDLSSLLVGSSNGSAGYSGESTLPSGSENSLFALKNQTISGTTASVDIYYVANSTLYDNGGAEFSFYMPSFVSSIAVKNGTSGLSFQTSNDLGKIVGIDVTDAGVIETNTKLATVTFTLSSSQTQFVFALTNAAISGDNVKDDVGSLATKDVPVPVIAGGTTTAITDLYTIKDDGSALTTVGDNEVHFANNATTGGVDIRYDTNKSAGTTELSDIIHLDGITDLNLSRTDFIFG
jgi:Putative Ig domain/RTX calcium-binding nonapeptide repeat (4 copies)